MPVHCTDYTFCGMESLPSPLITKEVADISHLAFPQVRIPIDVNITTGR